MLPTVIAITVEPILVGRNAEKLAALAVQHGVADFTTDLDEALERRLGLDLLRRPGHLGA